jgi:hypothetical protein
MRFFSSLKKEFIMAISIINGFAPLHGGRGKCGGFRIPKCRYVVKWSVCGSPDSFYAGRHGATSRKFSTLKKEGVRFIARMFAVEFADAMTKRCNGTFKAIKVAR